MLIILEVSDVSVVRLMNVYFRKINEEEKNVTVVLTYESTIFYMYERSD